MLEDTLVLSIAYDGNSRLQGLIGNEGRARRAGEKHWVCLSKKGSSACSSGASPKFRRSLEVLRDVIGLDIRGGCAAEMPS